MNSNILRGKYLLLLAGILAIVVLVSSYIYFDGTAYAVSIDDKVIGIVKERSAVDKVIEEIKSEMSNLHKKEINVEQEISIERIRKKDDELTSSEDMKANLYKSLDFKIDTYAINVDGKDLVYLENEDDAEKLLQEVKGKYLSRSKQLEKIGFDEVVTIKSSDSNINNLMTYDEALNYILFSGEEIQKYEVESADTAWDIAIKYDIDLDDLISANSDIDLEGLQIGQEINLSVPKPYINVKTVESEDYEEKIPFEITYEETDKIYTGENKVKVNGEEGLKKVDSELIKINGILSQKNIIKEEVLKEPKDAVVLVGTKKRPKTMADGNFKIPSRGSVSSRFGQRWGRAHEGIDIAGSVGTPIKAADGLMDTEKL